MYEAGGGNRTSLPPVVGDTTACLCAVDMLREAWQIIADLDSELASLMRYLVVSVVCMPYDDQRPEGYSKSDAIGVIWIQPSHKWTAFDFACTLVHEFVHSVLNLDDMVRGLYAVTPQQLAATPATSSIRKTNRPYDKAFHAAIVSLCVACFCSKIQSPEMENETNQHLADIQTALPTLLEGSFCLSQVGASYLRLLIAHFTANTAEPAVTISRTYGNRRAPHNILDYAARNFAKYGGTPQELHGERKVLNKYFPPDFDPAAIPRRKMDAKRTMQIRMMLPMSICCTTCNNFMYAGTKFNSKKEDVMGPDGYYLGIKIFRFTIKCTVCSSGLTFKTDPKNADYEAESGCTRNFELWREKEKVEKEMEEMKDKDAEGDAMRELENKTMDSKMEMDILDALDEMRAQNSRHEKVDVDQILEANRKQGTKFDPEKTEKQDKQDEDAVRAAFAKTAAADSGDSSDTSEDEATSAAAAAPAAKKKSFFGAQKALPTKQCGRLKRPAGSLPNVSVTVKKAKVETAASAAADVGSLLGGYGSSDSSSD
jgi:hypothetical protein